MLVWTLARYLISQQKCQIRFVRLATTVALHAQA
jgi:hypothetical protein